MNYEISTTIVANKEQIEAVARFYGWDYKDDVIEFAKGILGEKIKDLVGEPAKVQLSNQLEQIKIEKIGELSQSLDQIIKVEICEIPQSQS